VVRRVWADEAGALCVQVMVYAGPVAIVIAALFGIDFVYRHFA
jgi:Flp pilus assembly pilin Flp